jgi:peptide deformylase
MHDHITQVGSPVLRKHAEEVPPSEIQKPKIQKLLADMKEALEKEPDGAALAAPQLGISLRIFMLAERVFGENGSDKKNAGQKHLVFINPVIVKRSKKKATLEEGCLSVRGKYGLITRSLNVTIEAYDEHGEKFSRGAGGLLAQAFQHECDHLDGVLFVDSAKELFTIT